MKRVVFNLPARLCIAAVSAVMVYGLRAEPPKPAQPAPKQSAPRAKPTPPAPPPTLDELLGIAPKADKAAEARPAAPDPARQDLERRLSGATVDDEFKEAVVLMARSAQRLRVSKDTGLDTQRLQEDALRKLDGLISQLQKQSRQQQQQPQQNSQSDDAKSQPRQQQPRPDDARRGDNNAELEPPARREGALRPGIEAAKAAWGALPARVREMLLQGSGEKFSTTYEKLTEEYYKKLAEQRP